MAVNLPKDVLARHPEWGFIPPGLDPVGNAPDAFQDNVLGGMNYWGPTNIPDMRPRTPSGAELAATQFGQSVAPDTDPNIISNAMPLPNWQPGTPMQPPQQGVQNAHRTDQAQGYPVPFAGGGTVNIGNLDPNDPATVAAAQNGTIQYNPALSGEGNVTGAPSSLAIPNSYGSAVPQTSTGSIAPVNQFNPPPPTAPYALPGSQSGPIAAQWNAENTSTMASAASLDAQRNSLAFQPQVRAADSAVLDAQTADLAANRAYLNEQLRASQMSQQAQQKIQAAKANTADITAVGQEQNLRNNSDYLYQLAGLKAPVDLQLPADFKGDLPPGTRAKLETLADWLTEKASDADTMEKFNVEAARIHAANTGTDVTAAQIAAGRVHLTLDELDTAAKSAGLNAQSAALQVNASKQSPAPGLVWNVVKNKWTSPEEEAYDSKQYGSDFNSAQNTPLGGIPSGTLMSMFASGVIATPEQLRQGLIDGGMDPATAGYYVNQAQYEKDNAAKGSLSLAALLAKLPAA